MGARTKSAGGSPTTPPFSLYTTAVPGAGKSIRVMSLSKVADMLGVSRNTVMRWINDGCPVARAPATKGESYDLDLAAVFRWVQAEAVTEAKRKAGEDRAGTRFFLSAWTSSGSSVIGGLNVIVRPAS